MNGEPTQQGPENFDQQLNSCLSLCVRFPQYYTWVKGCIRSLADEETPDRDFEPFQGWTTIDYNRLLQEFKKWEPIVLEEKQAQERREQIQHWSLEMGNMLLRSVGLKGCRIN